MNSGGEVRCQRSEGGGAEVGGQVLGVRGQRSEVLSTGGLAPPERMFDPLLFASGSRKLRKTNYIYH